MSREDVEFIEEVFRTWNRGDREGLLQAFHPEAEWSSAIQRQVEGSESLYIGRAELGQYWDEWHALWDLEMDIDEVRDLGDQRLLVFATGRGTGKGSGVDVERPFAFLMELEDGLVRRATAYLTHTEALEAAGLSD
jgi:ketosteroid isomerase-like protein